MNPRFLLLALALLLGMAPMTVLRADINTQMFGGTSLTIQGENYTWISPAAEDGTWHTDTYMNGFGLTVSVTGMMSNPSLATVSGDGPNGPVSGYIQNGVYAVNAVSYTESGSFDQAGYTFDQHSYSQTSSVDFTQGQVLSSTTETWTASSNGGRYTYTSDSSGNWSWALNESTSGTSSSSPANGQSSFQLFGTTYYYAGTSYSSSSSDSAASSGSSASNDTSGWTDQYTTSDNSVLNISCSTSYSNTTGNLPSTSTSTSISGWDAYAGAFSVPAFSGGFTGLDGLTWSPRTAATFAPAQLWVNGTLVNWMYGQINSSGTITDTYYDSSNSIGLTISDTIRDFLTNGGNATVTINGNYVGTFTQTSGITTMGNSSWDIETIQPPSDPPSDPPTQPQPSTYGSPFFSPAATLWVNGYEYPFSQGYDDGYGNRTDTYSNASFGVVTLSGNTSNSSYASISANCGSTYDYGAYYGGDSFSTSYLTISSNPPPPLPTVYGQDAYWVGGRFYARVDPSSNDFQSTSDASTLTLSSSDGGNTLTISSTGSTSPSFSGSFPTAQTGAFLVQDDQGASTVVVVPASSSGSLVLDGLSYDSSYEVPPAVRVSSGSIWQFLGMVSLPAGSTAVYGNAINANSTVASTGGGQLLQIDPTGAVTLTDCLAGTRASGTYSLTTHLFQTSAPGSGFPVPLYGVAPTSNHRLWGLTKPADGPETFLVGGAVWRYAGNDTNGHPVYQGYYSGQQLTLGAAAQDGRVLTITDPFNSSGTTSTQGTYSNVRGSAHMSDGTEVYSGNCTGQQFNPILNDSNLQTIAADLDITGNVVTFGALTGSTATAGVTLQFQDVTLNGSLTASLINTLARPQAQWQWARAAAAGSSGPPTLPVMQLDASSKLTLYDHSTGSAGVVLDPTPNGVSSISGTLRVRPGGDIDMGEFTASPTGTPP